jgi:hypothetical protein
MTNEYREEKDHLTGSHLIVWTVEANGFDAFEQMVCRYDPFQAEDAISSLRIYLAR